MSANTVYTTPDNKTLVGDAVVYAYIKSLTERVVEAINESRPGFTVESTDDGTGEYIYIMVDGAKESVEFYIANPIEEHANAWTWIAFDAESESGRMGGDDAPKSDADPAVVAEWFVDVIHASAM